MAPLAPRALPHGWDKGTATGGCRGTPPALLTFNGDLAAPHQVTFVAHQDDGDVLELPHAAQLDAQLRGALEAAPIRDGVDDDIGVPDLQALAAALAPFALPPHGE